MKTFVVTIIYRLDAPYCYEVQANTRAEAMRIVWTKYEDVSDHIQKVSVVLK